MPIRSVFSRSFSMLAVSTVAAFSLLAAVAEARPGKSGSAGSRGERTYTAPPTTTTAPKQAAPMDKSMTSPSQAKPSAAAAGAGATAAAAQAGRPSMMRNLLLGGLLGAGLATLFGAGALANVLGFVLQGLLIGGLIYLAIAFFRSRSAGRPAVATASAASQPQANLKQANLNRQAVGGGLGGGAATQPLNITGDDFNAFERLLGEIQLAYGRGDVNALGDRTTSEMLSYFAGELDDNRKKGVQNALGAPTLLQGDLSEAWREAGSEYATVAMRYSLTDATIDAKTGAVVSGSTTKADEVTELWTFRRNPGANASGWELSAIQQA